MGWSVPPNVHFGSLADIAACPTDVRLPPKADILGLRSLKANAARITIHLSRVMGLSDRDGSHVRVDGRVDLVRAVCGRADPFGNRNGSTMRRRMS